MENIGSVYFVFFIRSFSYRILHFFIYKNKLCKQNKVEAGKKEQI